MRMAISAASVVVGLALGGAGCGATVRAGPEPAEVITDPGDIDGPPRLDAIPQLSERDRSERLRFGLMLAEQAFGLPNPTPLDETHQSLEDIERWAETDLGPWLQQKSHAVQLARDELDGAAGETYRRRVVAGAVVALLYEDFGETLRNIPTPSEIERIDIAVDAYRDLVNRRAAPYLDLAEQAYGVCQENAETLNNMPAWKDFCAARLARLQSQRAR